MKNQVRKDRFEDVVCFCEGGGVVGEGCVGEDTSIEVRIVSLGH